MIGYYYCSLETFLNIVKNKEIYLSDPLKMNDKSEIKWAFEKLIEYNIDKQEELINDLKWRAEFDFSFDELLNTLDLKGQKSVYISCFSKNPDLLSQWRAYADDGNGVSIGFDLDKIAASKDNLFVEEIKYSNRIEDLSEIQYIADEYAAVNCEKQITDKDEQLATFLHELIPVLLKYKNPAFSEEDEVRLIYCDNMIFETIVDSYGALEKPFNPLQLAHHFRTIKKNDITEFVKLEFEPDCITEIYIGPKSSLKINNVLNVTKKLLEVEPSVKISSASYH